jgi:dipeptidyl aminopeptidase/acylaminoacyl peptidase
LSDLSERDLLFRAFVARDAILDHAVFAALSSDARIVFELLSGVDLTRATELINALSPRALDVLDTISPETNIDQLEARVLLMHDREDQLVSSEESRRLAAALADSNRVYHTEFSLF